jgi:hypothetical protein
VRYVLVHVLELRISYCLLHLEEVHELCWVAVPSPFCEILLLNYILMRVIVILTMACSLMRSLVSFVFFSASLFTCRSLY